MHTHSITHSDTPMKIRVVNLKGNTAKLNWAADITQDEQFTHRLISMPTPGGHRVIVRDTAGEVVAEHTSPQPIAVDDVISWANTVI